MSNTDDIRSNMATIISLANATIAKANAIDAALPTVPTPPPVNSWWHTLNSVNPHYDADFVSGRYYAGGQVRTSLSTFLSSAGFTGNAVTGSGGLLMGTSGNMVWPSNNLSNTRWLKAGLSVSVTLLTESAASGNHEIYQLVNIAAGAANTASVKLKAGTRDKGRLWLNYQGTGVFADYDLTAGTVGTATAFSDMAATPLDSTITSLGSGFYRVTLSGIISSRSTCYIINSMRNADGAVAYVGAGGTMYMDEPQVEAGAEFTTYQATKAAPAAPSLIKSVITAPSAVTRVLHATTAATLPVDQYQVLHHLDNNVNTSNGYSDIEVYRNASGNLFIECKRLSTTITSGLIDLGPMPNNTSFKLAYTASAAGIVASLNGATPVTSTVTAWPTDLTQNRLNGNITGIRQWGGSLARDVLFFGTATGAQLQAFTA